MVSVVSLHSVKENLISTLCSNSLKKLPNSFKLVSTDTRSRRLLVSLAGIKLMPSGPVLSKTFRNRLFGRVKAYCNNLG